MNRLIIIGNGFDLAHKLKTSYCDFILNYINNSINSFYSENIHNDPLLGIKWKFSDHVHRHGLTSTPDKALKELSKISKHDYFKVNIKSILLSETLKVLEKTNWIDLENKYFNLLLVLKDSFGSNTDKIKSFNAEFEFLKNQLESYLLNNVNSSKSELISEYVDLFCEPIRPEDIPLFPLIDKRPGNILILNFNYTNTLKQYELACKSKRTVNLIYIHGELASKSNPLIFGFGDERNKDYQQFEDIMLNELLVHIKSFGYLKTSNYQNLLRFVNSDYFQVYIFGHSLGLSDRTMLNYIFEHKSCQSIKLFYHQKSKLQNDYIDKTFDMSRHFTDKSQLREKVVPFDLSFPMPQLK